MPRRHRSKTSPALPPDTPDAPAPRLTADQVDRWAGLIADGRGEFPDDPDPRDRGPLLAAVRRRLRDRMVRHIARAIALDLRRDAGPRRQEDGPRD